MLDNVYMELESLAYSPVPEIHSLWKEVFFRPRVGGRERGRGERERKGGGGEGEGEKEKEEDKLYW